MNYLRAELRSRLLQQNLLATVPCAESPFCVATFAASSARRLSEFRSVAKRFMSLPTMATPFGNVRSRRTKQCDRRCNSQSSSVLVNGANLNDCGCAAARRSVSSFHRPPKPQACRMNKTSELPSGRPCVKQNLHPAAEFQCNSATRLQTNCALRVRTIASRGACLNATTLSKRGFISKRRFFYCHFHLANSTLSPAFRA